MWPWLKSRPQRLAPAAPVEPPVPAIDVGALVNSLGQRASLLGREAAEVRGSIEDTSKLAAAQASVMQSLDDNVAQVRQSQTTIGDEAQRVSAAVERTRDAVQVVGAEVAGIVLTLRDVSKAASDITQIALQTRLVAFNAAVEAKRAGDAGRGFGVVADAVKDLAARVEASSKAISSTVKNLDRRIEAMANEIRLDPALDRRGALCLALADADSAVRRSLEAADHSQQLCSALSTQMGATEADMRHTRQVLDGTLKRTETFLEISQTLIETVAECGVQTSDSPFIAAAQAAALQVEQLLAKAIEDRRVSLNDLFDEQYQAIEGTAPAQHRTRFVAIADELFPQVQEAALAASDKVVFCIAVDRNGYVACHNRKYNNAQRAGELVWNTANCRNRRIFNDRTGLASARNTRPFLLQTYRRDMGGGQFVVLKEVASPISVGGRHWGGLRLAFHF